MHSFEREFWTVVLVIFCILDTVTTAVVLTLGGYESAQPAGWFYSQFGIAGLALHKLLFAVALAIIWVAYHRLDNVFTDGTGSYRLLLPTLIASRGAWIVVWNVSVVAELLGVPTIVDIPNPNVMFQ
ncbi:hypothetical protein SAMN05216226_102155 [Halovenus aranensis]|uniref:DUF5658 domain-containing protein n=1 Tax=Halovenus aranensis TaxID=890420 RepID=A0A1G8SUM9_9EURY|nr:hypothetical protein [Halovenus aranensis]SDJ32957.1 hypothetical protein SAMN05216226_102155 [Halovenus aranensis]